MNAGQVPDVRSLLVRAAKCEAVIFEKLEKRNRLTRRANPDPEIVRVLGRIKDELSEIQRLVARADEPRGEALAALERLLDDVELADRWSLEFAREVSYSARTTTPLFADREYLQSLLALKDVRAQFASLGGSRLDTIEHDLAAPSCDPQRIADIGAQLRQFRMQHSTARRKSHAQLAIRTRELRWILVILVLLVVGNGAALAFAGESRGAHVLVATFAGAVGSVLSGSFKLRDDLKRLRDLRSFGATIAIQPFVGAASGLIAFALVAAGILHLPPPTAHPSTPAYAIYGFVIGFSEPFLLDIVRRAAQPDGK